jgi:ubiquitin-protein ligase
MGAFEDRIRADIDKIEQLSKTSAGRVRLVGTPQVAQRQVTVELRYKTASGSSYPREVQDKTTVKFDLLNQYPFKEPVANITTPIFHPNVYASGRICFGTKWIPSEGLDLLVKRVIQIITFDPMVVKKEEAPANNKALIWYKQALRSSPEAFPTEPVGFKAEQKAESTIKWKNKDTKTKWKNKDTEEIEKTIVKCKKCGQSLRVPKSKQVKVTCPKCKETFEIQT